LEKTNPRCEVEVQKVLQGLRVAEKIPVRASIPDLAACVDLGVGGSVRAGRFDVHTTVVGTEARQYGFTTRIEFVRSLHLKR
jgi:hypothetical protein